MASFSRHAVLEWTGGSMKGAATVAAGSSAFSIPASSPMLAGEPPGTTTPEEMLAASHATCYGIGLRSLIAQKGGQARRVKVTAIVTADKGASGIAIRSSHLVATVEAREGIHRSALQEIGRTTEQGCTISNAIRAAVAVSFEISAS